MAKNYKLNHATMTITFAKKFLARVESGDGDAYAEYVRLCNDFSRMTIVEKPKQHRTNKTQIGYAKMERFIECHYNADMYMKMFEDVKKVSLSQQSAYNYVRNWFMMTFPYYREMPRMDEDGYIIAKDGDSVPKLHAV